LKKQVTLFTILTMLALLAFAITAWSAEIKVVEVLGYDMFGEDANAYPAGTYEFQSVDPNSPDNILNIKAPKLSAYTNHGWKIINIERMGRDWRRITLEKEAQSVTNGGSADHKSIEQLEEENNELRAENQKLKRSLESGKEIILNCVKQGLIKQGVTIPPGLK
jgi:hypothetical protein